ncbi:MAG TPA: hypothetical protein VER32_00205, partial [Pyrinomonadaceae bacterium]|nr:hypothetical protein [Pyrinomonadaceae bacterium]
MLKTVRRSGATSRARALCVAALFTACAGALAALPFDTDAAAASSVTARKFSRARQGERVDLRLRSFVPGASGQLTIEASAEGGRGRLTALGLPPPESQSRGATTYVVWANSEGRIQRLGELRRDERGNGGLAFAHPAPFERYTVIVTAEADAEAERPAGAPILSTRANEAAALHATDAATPTTEAATATPPATSNANTAPAETRTTTEPTATSTPTTSTVTPTTEPSTTGTPATTAPERSAANMATTPATSADAGAAAPSSATRPASRSRTYRPRRTATAGFYGEVDGALAAAGGGRALRL